MFISSLTHLVYRDKINTDSRWSKLKKSLIIILLIIIPFNVYAYEKKAVTLNKCVDGDTAWFNLNEEKIKARFLAIDTPESTNKIEFFGKEASKYTCNKLKKANKIEIEYDENSNKYDGSIKLTAADITSSSKKVVDWLL